MSDSDRETTSCWTRKSSCLDQGLASRTGGLDVQLSAQKFPACQVRLKDFLLGDTVLQASQMQTKKRGWFGWNAIDHPLSRTLSFNHLTVLQIGEMPGNFNLGLLQGGLQMADTHRTAKQKMDNAQPCLLTEALVNLEHVHMPQRIYASKYKPSRMRSVPCY